MKVVAVVVTYKRKLLLAQVVDSLLQQTTPLTNILIIDNNSLDGTKAFIRELCIENTKISYHNTGANLGGAGGFHKGFELAEELDYDYLWLMDDDLLPEVDCLENLLSVSHQGISQPVRFNAQGDCVEMSPVEYNLNKVLTRNPKQYSVADVFSSFQAQEKTIEIASVPFEGPLIHRSVIEKIGFPEPLFFITGDDTEYSLRATNAGFKIICNLNARATRLLIHDQNDDLFTWKGYFILRNHFFILRKYGRNVFVRNRSIFILLYFATKAIFRLDFNALIKANLAFYDSFTLKNNDRHKPK